MNIKSYLKITLLSAFLLSTLPIMAQRDERHENIVRKIELESDGNVVIDIPPALLEIILQPSHQRTADSKGAISKANGFRIQVFSDGRNQSTLEARAKARGNAILARFPKYRGQIYTFSNSPNWYTRIGNFKSTTEANAALEELKRSFPNFASEMRVVKSQIVHIKQ